MLRDPSLRDVAVGALLQKSCYKATQEELVAQGVVAALVELLPTLQDESDASVTLKNISAGGEVCLQAVLSSGAVDILATICNRENAKYHTKMELQEIVSTRPPVKYLTHGSCIHTHIDIYTTKCIYSHTLHIHYQTPTPAWSCPDLGTCWYAPRPFPL